MKQSLCVKSAGALLICVLVSLCACSRAAPSISFWSMRLVYYEDSEGITPRLSFFALVSDDDGPEDIEELRLYHDAEGLLWSFKSENWVTVENENGLWVGAHTVTMPDGEPLPAGQWRAVIIDKSGERSERAFGFDAPQESIHPFPKFTVKESAWTLESEYPEHFVLCYNDAGEFMRTLLLQTTSGTLQTLGMPPETASICYWGEDAENKTAALSRPATVR